MFEIEYEIKEKEFISLYWEEDFMNLVKYVYALQEVGQPIRPLYMIYTSITPKDSMSFYNVDNMIKILWTKVYYNKNIN